MTMIGGVFNPNTTTGLSNLGNCVLTVDRAWFSNTSNFNELNSKKLTYDDVYNRYEEYLREVKGHLEKEKEKVRIPEIKDVTIRVENKVVEVTFKDNTKEKSVCLEPDTFDLERAISICIAKKVMGGSSAYNNAVKKGLKVYKDKLKQEAADKAEKERIEKKRAKLKVYKQRRREKREAAERQKQIDIQKEAYIQAMEYMKDKDEK